MLECLLVGRFGIVKGESKVGYSSKSGAAEVQNIAVSVELWRRDGARGSRELFRSSTVFVQRYIVEMCCMIFVVGEPLERMSSKSASVTT